jgi:hypothetical protein
LLPAQITSPGFELGTTGSTVTSGNAYNFTAPASLPGINPAVKPTQGRQFGLSSDYGVNLLDGEDTETVPQTFTIASTETLSLDYRFPTDDWNVPACNLSAQITLSPTVEEPITLAGISRNNLQTDPADAGPLSAGAAYNAGGLAIGQNALQTVSFDVSPLAGQQDTLAFSVNESSFAFLAVGFGVLGFLKLARHISARAG